MKDEILDYFQKNINDFIHNLSDGDGGGLSVILPIFELTPRDFIEFAEKDLEGELTSYKLVNATSNLKRAIDSKLDYLLTFLNLDDLYRKKRLGIDKKLGFFNKAGIFNSRSFTKLNNYRNRLEHHYEIPAVQEVDVYYDLVVAFVSISESFVFQLMSMGDINLYYYEPGRGRFACSTVDITQPSIELILGNEEDKQKFIINLDNSLKPDVSQIEEFAFLLKVHILLINLYHGAISNERFLVELQKPIDT